MSSRAVFSTPLSTAALYCWIQTFALGFAKRIRKLGRFLQRLNVPRAWAILAVCQGLILLLLLLTWPRSVTVSLLLPESEARVWVPLIQEFQRQNPNIRIARNVGSYTTDQMEAIYTSDSRNVNPSFDLLYLEFFTSEEAQRKLVLESGYLPSRRALFTGGLFLASREIETFQSLKGFASECCLPSIHDAVAPIRFNP